MDIAAPTFAAVFLDTEGSLWSVGNNLYGRNARNTGSGTTKTITKVPVQPEKFVAITSHQDGGYGLSKDGRLYSWGQSDNYLNGNGTNTPAVLAPTLINTTARFKKISAATSTVIALSTDNEAYVWGSGKYGQLGNGSTTTPITRPTKLTIPNGEKVKDVSAGVFYITVVTESGKAYACGNNEFGKCGTGTSSGNITTLKEVKSPVPLERVYNHNTITFAIGADGNTYYWGANREGQSAGLPTVSSPTLFTTPEPFVHFYSRHNTCLALSASGKLYGWGNNTYGQLHTGDTTHVSEVRLYPGLFEQITRYLFGKQNGTYGTIFENSSVELTQISDEILINYGSETLADFDRELTVKNYVANVSEAQSDGLVYRTIDRKPTAVTLGSPSANSRLALVKDGVFYTVSSSGVITPLANATAVATSGFTSLTVTQTIRDTFGDAFDVAVYTDTADDFVISTQTAPFRFYDEFNGQVGFHCYVNSDVDSISVKINANYTPLDALVGDFEVLTWADESAGSRTLEVKGERIGYSDITTYALPSGDVSLLGVESIDKVNVIASGSGRIAASVDSGSAWQTFKDGAWSVVDDIADAMTYGEFNALSTESLALLRGASHVIRFGYYLTSDTEIDAIEMRVSMLGREQLAPTSSHTVSYDRASQTITYRITKSGTYSINYVT